MACLDAGRVQDLRFSPNAGSAVMRTKTSLAAALLMLALASVSLAQGQRYTVGVEDYENFLPYSQYKGGVYSGLGRDILDAFAKQRGYQFDYKVYPLKRRDSLFVAGAVDLAFPDNPNWVTVLKKGLKVAYAPMLEFTDGVLVRPQHKGQGVDRIRTLGIPLGFTPYPYQQLISSGAMRLEESIQYDRLYDKLIRGRVDGAYMNTRIAMHYWTHVEHYAEAPVVFDPDLPNASGHWFLSSHKHPRVVEEFNVFMKSNKALIDELKARYQFQ